MSNTIDITGLPKALLLSELYNDANPQGMGFLHFVRGPMPQAELDELVSDPSRMYFDYVKGRVMKVDLRGNELNPYLYDRDNGAGSCERAVNRARELFAATSSAT